MARVECMFCRKPASQWHHPTQKEWDRPITVPLCYNHHRAIEHDRPTVGYGAGSRPETALHLLAMSLTRWGMLLGRLAAAGVFPSLTRPLAAWLIDAAVTLRQSIAGLDAAYGTAWWTLAGITLG